MDKLEEIVKLQLSLQKRVATDPRIPPWKPRRIEYTIIERGRGIGQTGMMDIPKHLKFDFLPGQERMKAWMNHVIAEAIETKEELGFTNNDQLKHWKHKIDWNAVDEEMADILHFLLAAWIESIIESLPKQFQEDPAKIAEAIYFTYKKKLEENHARQDRGY